MGEVATRLRTILDRTKPSPDPPRPPAVVLATGGSGTRALAMVMKEAGIYIGPKLNRAYDSLELKPFLVRWSAPYLTTSRWVEAIEADPEAEIPEPPKAVADDLRAAIGRQREGIGAADSIWGWKNPRTSNLLPVLNAVAPGAITAHLVRDGRDIAYSKNQNQPEDCRSLVPERLRDAPMPVRSIDLWSRMNLASIAYMRRSKGDGHIVIRYEDLCADPSTQMERLLTHFGVTPTGEVLALADELISLAPSHGRWRDAPKDELAAVLEAGAPALAEFGYE